jgi:hypothetical protein
MNSTTNQTTITVTTAKPQANNTIKKVVMFDRYGRAHKVEKLRRIQL